jgi:hypothetical protein
VSDRRAFAQDTLQREMKEICFALTRQQWVPGMEFKLYAVLVGDRPDVDGQRLAAPLLAHIDGLDTFSADAGGWYTGDRLESFLPMPEWKARYASWRSA